MKWRCLLHWNAPQAPIKKTLLVTSWTWKMCLMVLHLNTSENEGVENLKAPASPLWVSRIGWLAAGYQGLLLFVSSCLQDKRPHHLADFNKERKKKTFIIIKYIYIWCNERKKFIIKKIGKSVIYTMRPTH